MTIAPLTEAHVPEALALLKTSLQFTGDAAWFGWKHRQSPFGPSPGYVALEGSRLIGVRLFMPWQFEFQGKIYRALRPVDTATHPDARGKGVFKKLTLEALDHLKGSYDFVFNTPNQQSYPGYRKMGWQDWTSCRSVYFGVMPARRTAGRQQAVGLVNARKENAMRTKIDPAYLQWRYQMHPARFYQSVVEPGTGVAVDTIRKGPLSVLRIRDFWGDPALYASLIAGVCWHEGTWVVLDVFSSVHEPMALKWFRPASRVVFRGDEALRQWPVCFSLGDIDGRI